MEGTFHKVQLGYVYYSPYAYSTKANMFKTEAA